MRTEFVRYLRQHGEAIKQAGAELNRQLSVIVATHHWHFFKRAWEKEELSFVLMWLGEERHKGALTTIVSRHWSVDDYTYFVDNVAKNNMRGVQTKLEFRTVYAIIYERAKRHWVGGELVSVVSEVSRHRWPLDARSGAWKSHEDSGEEVPGFVQLRGRLLHAAARGDTWSNWHTVSDSKVFRRGGCNWTSQVVRLGMVTDQEVPSVVRVACKLLGLVRREQKALYDPQVDEDVLEWEIGHFELLLKLLDIVDYATLCARQPNLERLIRNRCLRRRLFPESASMPSL